MAAGAPLARWSGPHDTVLAEQRINGESGWALPITPTSPGYRYKSLLPLIAFQKATSEARS